MDLHRDGPCAVRPEYRFDESNCQGPRIVSKGAGVIVGNKRSGKQKYGDEQWGQADETIPVEPTPDDPFAVEDLGEKVAA